MTFFPEKISIFTRKISDDLFLVIGQVFQILRFFTVLNVVYDPWGDQCMSRPSHLKFLGDRTPSPPWSPPLLSTTTSPDGMKENSRSLEFDFSFVRFPFFLILISNWVKIRVRLYCIVFIHLYSVSRRALPVRETQ